METKVFVLVQVLFDITGFLLRNFLPFLFIKPELKWPAKQNEHTSQFVLKYVMFSALNPLLCVNLPIFSLKFTNFSVLNLPTFQS